MALSSGSRRTARAAEFTAPLTIPGGAVAGADVVRELAPEYSLTAWQVLRSALMWAGEEPALRGDLFERCAMVDWERELLEAGWEHELRCPLAVIVGELRDAEQAAPDAMSRACLCVTEWALNRGHVGTGLAFAEAAALCWPDHPRYAWTVGRLMRTYGRLQEAERWLKRAARIATSVQDWDAKTRALNSLGNVHYQAGNYPTALRTLQDALRSSRKHRLEQREGEILHDLFAVSMWSGQYQEAEEFAKEAFEIYRTGHPRLSALAHDVATFWIKRKQFARALLVLKDLPRFFEAPEERIRVLASLARAAGAVGESELFSRARDEADRLAADDRIAIQSAPAMLEIGLGAWSLGETSAAETALEEAIRLGGRSGEEDVVLEAETGLDAVRSGQPADLPAEPRRNAKDPLALRFVDSLEASAHLVGV